MFPQCEGLYVLWLTLSQCEIFSEKKIVFGAGVELRALREVFFEFLFYFLIN